jgi:hypothetical protein
MLFNDPTIYYDYTVIGRGIKYECGPLVDWC